MRKILIFERRPIMDAKELKTGLLHQMRNGFSIDLTEEEYKEKENEIRKIAAELYVNMKVLDLVERDYKLKLLVLSIASYFGFNRVTGEELLEASGLTCPEEINPMKYFFMKAGWTPYYLEYLFKEDMDAHFHEVIDTFYTDVEFYMDMSEQLQYVRLPNALRII